MFENLTEKLDGIFRKLKSRKAISSAGGMPYRITRRGLVLVRSEFDNR